MTAHMFAWLIGVGLMVWACAYAIEFGKLYARGRFHGETDENISKQADALIRFGVLTVLAVTVATWLPHLVGAY